MTSKDLKGLSHTYQVKCISEEGIYYLVNGWSKHNTFFSQYDCDDRCQFKHERDAKASLTKLLKTSAVYGLGYEHDKFEIEELAVWGCH